MTDLKELIELELEHFIEWEGDDKSIVTTVSTKLFAEHVAKLYADHIAQDRKMVSDHIPDAGKMVSDQLRGGTKKIGRPQIREVFLRNGARIEPGRDDLPDWVYEAAFELLEMAAPAVQGEPVSLRQRLFNGWEGCSNHGCVVVDPKPGMMRTNGSCQCVVNASRSQLYMLQGRIQSVLSATPQPAEQKPVYQRCEYCDGTGDVHSIDGEWRGACDCQQPEPDVSALVAGLVEVLETALFGTPLDDVPNRDNDDIWCMCYPHLPERASDA
ncbi:MAG: hypothetical protein GX071_10330, partial [Gammaproteobacteria bacterium]|nr:hypothetical protein [Gammaproteobacteria bacterium]